MKRSSVLMTVLTSVCLFIGLAVVWQEADSHSLQTARISSNGAGKTLTNSVGMEFVKISKGSFKMGSEEGDTDEVPVHRVTIGKDFYLGKYEVTQAEYEKVMGKNPSHFKNCPKCPVEKVSWDDAQEFIKKLNAKNEGTYRLPTEAEWEYACRAGTTTEFAFGRALSSDQANFDGNYPFGNASKGQSLRKTAEVGSYQPNAWGLYDMHGNVWEWVEDVHSGDYNGLPADGSANLTKGDFSRRVFRGGSWLVSGANLRCASRDRNTPSVSSHSIGFRVVLDSNGS
ncbi:MAG: formylglycine-generating enzyme family protein [Pyrinomonadaceae bacterium]